MEKLLNISIVVYEKIPQGLFLLIDVFVREKNVNKIFIIDNSKCRNAKLDLPFVEYIFNNGKNLGYGKAHNIALKKTLEENLHNFNKEYEKISTNNKLFKLTEELREAIKENRLLEYREEFIKKYESNNKKND